MTAGIVSAEGRDIGEGPYDSFLQIDAPINKGNSGGPTFNLKGEVVGVNTAIFSPSGGSVGIGFAIPARTVDSVVGSLEHGGVVQRGYLGVRSSRSVRTSLTASGSRPPGRAGRPGRARNARRRGRPEGGRRHHQVQRPGIKDAADLTRHVGSMKPGDKAEIAYLRDGAEKTVNVTLASQKNEQTAKADAAQRAARRRSASACPRQAGRRRRRQGRRHRQGRSGRRGGETRACRAATSFSMSPARRSPSRRSEGRHRVRKHDGKKAVLMRIQTADGSRFVAFAFPKA